MKQRFVFRIEGMDCAEEVIALKKTVGPLMASDDDLSFDLINQKMTVYATLPDLPYLLKAIKRAGLSGKLWEDKQETVSFWQKWHKFILSGLSGLFCLAGALSFRSNDYAGVVFYLVAIIAGGWTVAPKVVAAIRSLRPDMNFLMAIAVIGAIGIEQWFEAASVAFLFSLALALESWSVAKARKAIGALMAITPLMARVLVKGQEVVVAPEEVPLGADLLVKPGEKIPVDGSVKRGFSEIDQSPITGESMPVPKKEGDKVFAGTININGALEIRCEKTADDSTLTAIIKTVEQAQEKRSQSEQWVEKFARIYTPVVILIAIGILLLPPFLWHMPWSQSFYRALVMLVIACPCALVISTPVSIVAGMTAAAKRGVLIKGGQYLEEASRIKAVAFDKTGTLTVGLPTVTKMVCLSGHSEEELLERAHSLESRSDHPLARAIVAYCEKRGIKALPAENYQIIQGKGAIATFKGRPFWLGSHRYIEERGQETLEMHNILEEMASTGATVVAIGNEKHVCGFLSLSDEVRADAKKTMAELKALGMEKLVMLTGDNRETALSIAAKSGLIDVYSELLPEDKVAVIEKLKEKYGHVAMVGDGINDAPSMATATLSIAMGAAGSDLAIETADVALMSDDLLKLPWLIRHGRKSMATIRQNIVFALSIKALVMLFNFLGYTSLWSAILADTGATLIVITNALRLLR